MSVDPAVISREEVHQLAATFESAAVEDILRWCWDRFGTAAAIGTSFQGAGLVTIHHAVTHGFRFPVFTLDTGLLFPETIHLKRQLEDFFGIEIEADAPEQTVEQQSAEHGPELWARNPDLCCVLRKVLPLQRKLGALAVWITGLRRQQGAARQGTQIVERYHFDVLRDRYIVKLNPLATWSRDAVWAYLKRHRIPYNPLTDRGYRNIGCLPCTRPVADGQSERAGRWTGFAKSECGIHTFLGENI